MLMYFSTYYSFWYDRTQIRTNQHFSWRAPKYPSKVRPCSHTTLIAFFLESFHLMASSSLLKDEKRLGTIATKYFIFEAGLAVSEQKISNRVSIAESMLKEYEERVSRYDPTSDEYYDIFGSRCRACTTELLKVQMKAPESGIGFNKSSGAKLWGYFKNMKSEFLNHWCPHLKIPPSGDNNQKDDAFDKVRMHVWAFRKNRKIRGSNAKATSEDDIQPEVEWSSAPDSDSFYPIEMPTFKVFYDHHYLNSPSSSSGVSSSTIDSGCHSDSPSAKGTVVNVNRLILSRKQQRRKEREDRKKRKSVDFQQSKAGKVHTKMKKMKTSAAFMHAKALQTKNMIELLKLAESTNGKFGDSQDLFQKVKATIFSSVDTPVIDLSSDESDADSLDVGTRKSKNTRYDANAGKDDESDVDALDKIAQV